MSTTTYVTVTNNAIEESGADLATFDTGGADWSSNTNTLMNRMKRYVARAWKDIQQEAFDWGFLEEQAVVNVNPGVMFYTDGTPVSYFSTDITGGTINILDQDASTAVSAIPVQSVKDLTGISTDTKPFGYFDVTTTASTPITWSLKPGAEYFTGSYYDVTLTFMTQDIAFNSALTYQIKTHSALPSRYNYIDCSVVSVTADGGGTYTIVARVNSLADANIVSGLNADVWALVHNTSTIYYASTINSGASKSTAGTYKSYIHSWKSFNFSEETGIDDFQENIKEVDQKSFRTIDYFKAPATGEVPINYIPWEDFARLYDISSAPPGIPRVITRDNTNRFRLYPHPYYIFTLKFDYTRVPQVISAYNDVFKGLDEDYVDIVMWKALIYYGEFDEQPSVTARATKNYKNFLTRLEQLYRQKFHFKPARLC